MAQIADVLLIGSIGAVGAYFTNFMGFRDWLDVQVTGGEGQTFEPEPEPQPAPFAAGKSGNCSWDKKGGWCWSSTACGGACKACITNVKTTDVVSGCARARKNFIAVAKNCPGCKTPPKPVGTKCPYTKEGCGHLSPGSGCFQCRCSSICKGHPGTYPVTTANGTCTCPKSPVSLASCQKYCNTGGGTASIVNGKCQCRAPGYYCPYSQYGCANEKTQSSCFMCRCRGICRSRPGTYPSVKADGSCRCIALSAYARRFN